MMNNSYFSDVSDNKEISCPVYQMIKMPDSKCRYCETECEYHHKTSEELSNIISDILNNSCSSRDHENRE